MAQKPAQRSRYDQHVPEQAYLKYTGLEGYIVMAYIVMAYVVPEQAYLKYTGLEGS